MEILVYIMAFMVRGTGVPLLVSQPSGERVAAYCAGFKFLGAIIYSIKEKFTRAQEHTNWEDICEYPMVDNSFP